MNDNATLGETFVYFGDALKALGEGKVGGYLVRFSGPEDPDLTGDFFDALTDFNLDDDGTGRVPLLYDHGLDATIGKRRIGKGTVKVDDVGVWLEGQLNLRDDYEKAIYAMAEKGKLGLSSGSAGHMVDRVPAGKSARITAWPIVEASLTPTPAEPRTNCVPLKSLSPASFLKDSGLDYDDSWRDVAAAQAAVDTLSRMLLSCISACFGGMPMAADQDKPLSKDDKLARLRAEFDDFTADSLAVVAALMDDDADAAKSLAHAYHGKALTGLPLSDHSEAVLAAVSRLSDRLAAVADLRAQQGRRLSAARRDQVKALSDALAGLHARTAPAPDPATRLRLLALSHRHRASR